MLFVTTDSSTPITVGPNDQNVTVLAGVTLRSADEDAVIVNGGSKLITNLGSILGDRNAITAEDTAGSTRIINGAGAILFGGVAGAFLGGNFGILTNGGLIGGGLSAVSSTGQSQIVQNLAGGTIQGGSFGVALYGEFADLINAGTISARQYGISAENSGARINNSGNIEAVNSGIFVTGNDAIVRNSGSIDGLNAGITYVNSTGGLIRNSGEIDGQYGVLVFTGAGVVRIVNSGTIAGDVEAIDSVNGGPVSIRNFGAIVGGVSCGTAVDSISNEGEILGPVVLGGGADTFNGRGGSVSGIVSGGGGADTLIAGEGDTIWGNHGNDALRGTGAESWLNGGQGADRLFGGTGEDTFVYRSHLDSTVAASGQDGIIDFDRFEDRIDLSVIDADATAGGNQAFNFIGTELFSGTAGELRVANIGAGMVVLADRNGDGAADFRILLNGLGGEAAQFVSQDFVL